MRRILIIAAIWMAVLVPAGGQPAYTSPYGLQFTLPRETLTADFSAPPRNDGRLESTLPYARWYDARSYPDRGDRPWGPPSRPYPPPKVPAGVDRVVWMRERVLAVAQKFLGYPYQHHHIPDFDPGPSWPWLHVNGPHGGKGVDCSNFTSFCYNYGLGWKIPSGILKQARLEAFEGRAIRRLDLPASRPGAPSDYTGLKQTLATGDLLFIRRKTGGISHVIMWVGAIGRSPDGVPLVVDSHGDGVTDSRGVRIPAGIRLRPFREGSWYHTSFDHALRLIESSASGPPGE